MNELLPIGSVIVLKNNRLYMIIGYSPNVISSDDKYDYICTNTVTGLTKNHDEIKKDEDYIYIKKEDIKIVKYIGFNSSSFDEYKKYLKETNKQIDDFKKNHNQITDEDVKSIMNKVAENIDDVKIDNNYSELLPIGSIIRVDKTDVMICAYLDKKKEMFNRHFDYACCLYPSGLSTETILVGMDQIEKVIFIGFQDNRFAALKHKLEEING